MKGWLIPHTELPDHSGGVGSMHIKLPFSHPQRLPEQLVKPLFCSLFPSQELSQAVYIVLHIPCIGPPVILVIIIPVPRTSVDFWVYLDPLSCCIFRHEQAMTRVPQLPVILCFHSKFLIFILFSQLTGKFRQRPEIVADPECNCNRLPLFKAVHLWFGLFFPGSQGWKITMFMVKVIDGSARCSLPPGNKCTLHQVFPHPLIRLLHVKICQPLPVPVNK